MNSFGFATFSDELRGEFQAVHACTCFVSVCAYMCIFCGRRAFPCPSFSGKSHTLGHTQVMLICTSSVGFAPSNDVSVLNLVFPVVLSPICVCIAFNAFEIVSLPLASIDPIPSFSFCNRHGTVACVFPAVASCILGLQVQLKSAA